LIAAGIALLIATFGIAASAVASIRRAERDRRRIAELEAELARARLGHVTRPGTVRLFAVGTVELDPRRFS